MSVLVRAVGGASANFGLFGIRTPRRAIFKLDGGDNLIVVGDSNNAGAASGYGDHTGVGKIYVYTGQGAVEAGDWTLQKTITPSSGTFDNTLKYQYCCELMPNGKLAIAYIVNIDGAVRYRSLDTITWALSAEETVVATSANYTVAGIDVTCSENSVPVVATEVFYTAGVRNRVKYHVRRTSDNAWTQIVEANVTTSTTMITSKNYDVSCVCVKGGTASDRYLGFGMVQMTQAADSGVQIGFLRYNETTGAQVAAPVALRSSIGAGDIPIPSSGTAYGQRTPPRYVSLFSTGVGELTYGIISITSNAPMMMGRFTRNSGTGFNEPINPQRRLSGFDQVAFENGAAINYSGGRMNFIFSAYTKYGLNNGWNAINYSAFPQVQDDGTYVVAFTGYYAWDIFGWPDPRGFSGGSGIRVVDADSRGGIGFYRPLNTGYLKWQFRYSKIETPLHPNQTNPTQDTTAISSTPPIAMDADLDVPYPQYAVKGEWQFATDAGFTTSLRDYRQPDSKYVLVLGTDVPGVETAITDMLPPEQALFQGPWYVQSRLLSSLGGTSPWTAVKSFFVAHPPAATDLEPINGRVVSWGSAGKVYFTWTFSDSSETDYQTAFQIIAVRERDGAVIFDTGKTTAATGLYVGTIGAGYKNVNLLWSIRLWDRDNVAGKYSNQAQFVVADAPVVTITTPADGAVITTGAPSITSVITTETFAELKDVRFIFRKGSIVVYSSDWYNVYDPNHVSPYTVIHKPKAAFLKNHNYYTIEVDARDTLGLEGTKIETISTDWVPPASPVGLTLDGSLYSVEDFGGYVSVNWLDTGRDPDFSSWRIYRKDELLDSGGGSSSFVVQGDNLPGSLITDPLVDGAPGFQPIANVYTVSATYTYRDFLAPSGYRSTYKVTQVVNRFNDEVESENDATLALNLASDSYWLINPDDVDPSASIIRLNFVTADQYDEEYEEEEYLVIGRGRHVDRGSRIGIKGSLTLQFRDSVRGRSARVKKQQLVNLKKENHHLWLRTPFGDSYWTYIGNLGVTRVAGVGASHEACDVTLPYSEVYD